MKEAVRVLDDLPVREANSNLRAQISWELLPFLLITNSVPESAELKLALFVAETHLLSQHPLTEGWAKGTYTLTDSLTSQLLVSDIEKFSSLLILFFD